MTSTVEARPRQTRAFGAALVWLTAGLLLAACGPDIPAPRPLRAPAPPAAAVETETSADEEESPTESWVYSPIGKRDPFVSPVVEAGTRTVAPSGVQGPVTALQTFDLDRLTLKFTITGSSSPSAVLVDSTGTAHMVKVGDWVGKNWGKVSHIGREEITVTETIADQLSGKVYPVHLPITMPKSAAEEKAEQSLQAGSQL